jgi:predicted phosphodiesterase
MKEIFISDIHWPHHDKAAWNVTLKVIQARKPEIVHIGGDGIDFHSISRHPKALIDKTILKYEIDETRREISRLRKAAPNSQINYQEGNHDSRMQLFLRDQAPQLSELDELQFPVLARLVENGMRWIPENEKFRIGKLWHHHGHKLSGGGVSPAKSKFMKVFQNIIFGHHHTFDYFSVRVYGTNELLQSVANATLYTLEPEYAHHPHWHIGFTEVDYIMPSGDFSPKQVHINHRDDGSAFAIVGEELYEAYPDEDIDKFLTVNAKAIARRGRGRS